MTVRHAIEGAAGFGQILGQNLLAGFASREGMSAPALMLDNSVLKGQRLLIVRDEAGI